jgi:hypothetical protein
LDLVGELFVSEVLLGSGITHCEGMLLSGPMAFAHEESSVRHFKHRSLINARTAISTWLAEMSVLELVILVSRHTMTARTYPSIVVANGYEMNLLGLKDFVVV